MHTVLWPVVFVAFGFAAIVAGMAKEYKLARWAGIATLPFLILTIAFPQPGPTEQEIEAAVAAQAAATSAPTDASAPDMNLKTIGAVAKAGDDQYQACPISKEKFDAMTSALVQSDNQGYLDSTSDAVLLMPGMKVRILDHAGMLGTVVKLRILSGPDEGKSCWTAGDQQGIFVEGYP
jgi:hypothetical protein